MSKEKTKVISNSVGVDELMHTAPVRSKAPTGLAPRRPALRRND